MIFKAQIFITQQISNLEIIGEGLTACLGSRQYLQFCIPCWCFEAKVSSFSNNFKYDCLQILTNVWVIHARMEDFARMRSTVTIVFVILHIRERIAKRVTLRIWYLLMSQKCCTICRNVWPLLLRILVQYYLTPEPNSSRTMISKYLFFSCGLLWQSSVSSWIMSQLWRRLRLRVWPGVYWSALRIGWVSSNIRWKKNNVLHIISVTEHVISHSFILCGKPGSYV